MKSVKFTRKSCLPITRGSIATRMSAPDKFAADLMYCLPPGLRDV